MQEFIKINREDTVAVALKPLPKGSTVETDQNTVVLKEDIPQGHKFAVCQMPSNTAAVSDMPPGRSGPGTGCISIMYALPWEMC